MSDEFFAQYVPIPLVKDFEAKGWKDHGSMLGGHGYWSHLMTKKTLDERDEEETHD